MNSDNLQSTQSKLIQSGSRSNPGMNTLINDYTEYHVVLVVVGGFLVLIFILLSLFFWTQFKRAPEAIKHKWTFEKKAYFSLGALSTVVGLLIVLIVAANATNVLNPQHGFSLLIDSLGTPKAKWGLKERALFVSGTVMITLSLLLMVIVVANMQGAFAPIVLTLMNG